MSEAINNVEEIRNRVDIIDRLPSQMRGAKLDLILIVLGHKKATDICATREEDKKYAIENTVKELGLECVWDDRINYIDPNNRTLYVADTEANLKILQEAKNNDDQVVGELSGYPQTAIDAFIIFNQYFDSDPNTTLTYEEVSERIGSQPWAELLHFRLSRNHWREEVKTAEKWYEDLNQFAPAFLKEFLAYTKEARAWFKKQRLHAANSNDI